MSVWSLQAFGEKANKKHAADKALLAKSQPKDTEIPGVKREPLSNIKPEPSCLTLQISCRLPSLDRWSGSGRS
jgi:hypothetical protein